jgi:hypothetical protein
MRLAIADLSDVTAYLASSGGNSQPSVANNVLQRN